jgi:hypothetical protein
LLTAGFSIFQISMLGKLAVAPHNRWKFAGPAKDGLGTLVLALQANVSAKGGSSAKASK